MAMPSTNAISNATPFPDAISAAAFYDTWFPRVYAYFARRTVDAATAEDLTADAFERIVAALPAFEPAGDAEVSTRVWVYRIAGNVFKNALRSTGRRLARESGWGERWQLVADEQGEVEQGLALGQAIAVLAQEDREVLGLRFWDGLTAGEIAEVRGCSAREVYTTIERCLRALRRQLAAGRPDDPVSLAGDPNHATRRSAARRRPIDPTAAQAPTEPKTDTKKEARDVLI